MSLASLLLGNSGKTANGATAIATAKDAELDALFAKSKAAGAVAPGKPTFATSSTSSSTAAKVAGAADKAVRPPEEIIRAAKQAKRKNSDKAAAATAAGSSPTRKDKKRQRLEDEDVQEGSSTNGKAVAHTEENEEDISDDDEVREDDSEDEQLDPSTLVHEADLKSSGKIDKRGKGRTASAAASKKITKQNEDPAERDARTTFVGNVPVACATGKSEKKALVRHLINTLPKDLQGLIKMDTIRFRSLQLSAPVPTDSGVRQTGASASVSASAKDADSDSEAEDEDGRKAKADNHANKRARRWKLREEGMDSSEASKMADQKQQQKFLTASQKRKVAFIKGEVHEKAKSCNAYVVWAIKGSPSSSSNNDKESEMTAADLARAVIEHANNSVFEGHTLRVDSASPSTKKPILPSSSTSKSATALDRSEAIAAALEAKKASAAYQKTILEDEKRTLYIGSLDFEETEENLRVLCESLMKEERGDPPASSSSSQQNGGKAVPWVERVRVVKDAETGLGKGFAYVLFRDRECVDEMLALDPVRIKSSKRKLRVERCNTAKATAATQANLKAEERASALEARKAASKAKSALLSKSKDRQLSRAATGKSSSILSALPPPPRPDIGASLKELPKEDRKALKVGDEERQARRLAKKQRGRAELKMEKAKEILDKKLKAANRGGKSAAESKRSRVGAAGTAKKTRVRSDKMAGKKNSKKPEA